jgi:hypothetical protein
MLLLLLWACASAPVGDLVEVGPVEAVAEGEGLTLSRQTWSDRGSSGFVYRARLDRAARYEVRAADAVAPFSALTPPCEDPWVAINGGFYEGGKPLGLVVHEGKELSPLSDRGGSGVLFAGPAGLDISPREAWTPGPTEALQSIDRLVDGGKNLVKPNPDKAARAAIAIVDDAVEFILAFDSKSLSAPTGPIKLKETSNNGLALDRFADYLVQEVKADKAINLDGGVSAQMTVCLGHLNRVAIQGERGTINSVVGHRKLKYAE